MQNAMPALLRALRTYGFAIEPTLPGKPAFQEISFSLGTTHPVHEILGEALDRSKEPAYAWYIRVNDLPAFLTHIVPALEKRLSASPVAAYSGEIKLDFYRGGLRLVFERGHLTGAQDWRVPLYDSSASGGFPPLVFLQVLFGHRGLAPGLSRRVGQRRSQASAPGTFFHTAVVCVWMVASALPGAGRVADLRPLSVLGTYENQRAGLVNVPVLPQMRLFHAWQKRKGQFTGPDQRAFSS